MGKLIDLTVSAFTAETASDSPAPGGGSAAALAGGVAAGLIAMVCRLSLGREDLAASDEELAQALERSDDLRLRFLELRRRGHGFLRRSHGCDPHAESG